MEETLKTISSNLVAVDKKLHALLEPTRGPNASSSAISKDTDRRVTVNLRVDVFRIENIDVPKQQFACELALHVSWYDAEREKRCEDEEYDLASHEDDWHPEIYFPNAVKLDTVQKTFAPGAKDGIFELVYRIQGTFKSNFNLQDFPFDYQMLRISVSSKWNRDVVLFRQDPDAQSCITQYPTAIEDDQFEIQSVISTGVTFIEQYDFPGKSTFSICTFEIPIQRRQWVFILNHIPPIFLVVLLALVIFAIPTSLPGHRILVAVVLLLVAIVVKNIIHSSYLAKIYAVTFVDKYWLVCLVFIVLVAIESAVAAIITGTSQRKTFDLSLFIILLLIFIAIHVIFIVIAFRKARQVALKLNDIREYYSTLARGTTTLPREKEEEEPAVEENSKPIQTDVITPTFVNEVEAEPPATVERKTRYSRFQEEDKNTEGKFPPPLQAKIKADVVKSGTLAAFSPNSEPVSPGFQPSGFLIHDDVTVDTQPRLSSFTARDNEAFRQSTNQISEPRNDLVLGVDLPASDTAAQVMDPIPKEPPTYESFNPLSSLSKNQSMLSSDTEDAAKTFGDILARMSPPDSPPSKPATDNVYQHPKDSFRFERDPNLSTSYPSIPEQVPGNRSPSIKEEPDQEVATQSPRLSAFYKYNDKTPESAYVIPRYPSIAADETQVRGNPDAPYDLVPSKPEPAYSYPPSPGGPPKLTAERDTSGITKIEPIYVFTPGQLNAGDDATLGGQPDFGEESQPGQPLLPSGEPLYSTVPNPRKNKENEIEPDSSSSQDIRFPLISRVRSKSKEKLKMPSKPVNKTKAMDYPASDGWL